MFILIKYMLGMFIYSRFYVIAKVFIILSISLLHPKESFMPNFKTELGRKDFSMEQLPVDAYMLLCTQRNSISID